jgi:Flp pilus assembly protein TadG
MRWLTSLLRRIHRTWADSTGSVLMLFPAGVLIILSLGAIAADSAVVFLGERELAAVAAAAANDAVTYGIDENEFRDTGRVVIDPAVAREIVWERLAAHDDTFDLDPVRIDFPDAVTVVVTVSGTAPRLFAAALPGSSRAPIDARARAQVRTR